MAIAGLTPTAFRLIAFGSYQNSGDREGMTPDTSAAAGEATTLPLDFVRLARCIVPATLCSSMPEWRASVFSRSLSFQRSG